MERRRPRKSSRQYVRSKSNPSVGGGVAEGSPSSSPATAKAVPLQPDGNRAPTITSLLGGRLKTVSRIAKAPHSLQVTENPEEGGAPLVPERESGASESSEVSPGVMVIPEAASPRGSAVHGTHVSLIFSGTARNSDSPRISEEVQAVFPASARSTVSAPTVGNLRFDSTPVAVDTSGTGNINFAPESYYEENRYSTISSDDSNDARGYSSQSMGACRRGWTQRQRQTASGPRGRDTLGFAINLGTTTLGHNRCSLGVACDEDCGYGTGCDAACGEAHGIDPGSFYIPNNMGSSPLILAPVSGGPPAQSTLRGAQGGGYKPVGAGQRGTFGTDFGSDQLNFIITFLLEVLGVLVFFAICTITFWITLGYHVVQLLMDLKNADRNVQVAVAIVFGLLLVAFAISQVTNLSGSCCHSRDRSRSRTKCGGGGISFFHGSSKSRTKTKSCAHKPKIKKAATCGPSLGFHSHKKTRYTDCEGRAIFLSSRRYAIPTEMKQPPTIVLWMRDALARMIQ